ncbi:putative fimbrial adhesin [Escherichia coli]|nr:putative fimbrial adhesin [Escherichia coli]
MNKYIIQWCFAIFILYFSGATLDLPLYFQTSVIT